MQLYKFLKGNILPLIGRFLKTPNQITLLGFGIAIIVPFGFYADPMFGLLIMTFSGLFDIIDGMMAKEQDLSTPFGALLDSSLDRASDFCFLIGFWILFWGTGREIPAAVLTFIACLFTFMISYIKARAEGLGCTIEKGLMERGARTLYLIVWALIIVIFRNLTEAILWTGLILFCVLTFITVLQRFFEVRLFFMEVDNL
jgi:CDP-diacylglycerol--glycerol-3-phosphate 3-phosphatidyltransferase